MLPIFRVKCKIDGEPSVIAIQTHDGNPGKPGHISTMEQAVEHVKMLGHKTPLDANGEVVQYGDPTIDRWVAHVDADGYEHTITDVEPDVAVTDPALAPKIQSVPEEAAASLVAAARKKGI